MEWINLKDIYLNFYSRRVTKVHPVLFVYQHLIIRVQLIFKQKCEPYGSLLTFVVPGNWNDDNDEAASNANCWKPPSRDRRFKKYSESGSADAC
jgi:hypothetical protein